MCLFSGVADYAEEPVAEAGREPAEAVARKRALAGEFQRRAAATAAGRHERQPGEAPASRAAESSAAGLARAREQQEAARGRALENARLLSVDVPGQAETWGTVGSNGEPESLFLLERHYDGTWLVKMERFLAPC